MRANFTACAAKFLTNATLQQQWGWNGTIIHLARNFSTQISKAGCEHLCGKGPDYYSWQDASSTITTWILPIIGTLLQAPFESNAFKRTLLAITRWVGSPIASISYVLWNINVSGKAALMVDMAVPYEATPERRTDFGSMRDSMYLLLAMNQYNMKHDAAVYKKEAEGLLRIVLFSKDLKLTDTDKTLRQMRRILARELREMRRRGAVPVFVSTMWFLFAFALSIQAAFGDFGENRTAHDLALGCLLAWFPILIMSSIVDRNPIAATAIKRKLNALVDHVRHALHDDSKRNDFLESFNDQPEFESLKHWINEVSEKSESMEEFFTDFAGQARLRWHYGAAHPILSDIESCYIAQKKRNWLADEKEARTSLVLGPVNNEGLMWFDIREYWQVVSAIIIVGASCGGAFIISFFTPTVGLGCRSGGYVIFFSIALFLLIVEMVVWLVLSPYQPRLMIRTATLLHNNPTFDHWDYAAHDRWTILKRQVFGIMGATKDWSIRSIVKIVQMLPWKDKEETGDGVRDALHKWTGRLRDMSARQRWEWFFFHPLETINTAWLIYIVAAQTFGSYKTCDCVTSNWGSGGGYLDFQAQDVSNTPWVALHWKAGTFLTSFVMGLAMIYITVEWCQQSFLTTENYEDAMQGLRMTRAYRHWTFAFRITSRVVSRYTLDILAEIAFRVGIVKKPQMTLLWQKGHTWNPSIPHPSFEANLDASGHRTNPSIELSDFSMPIVRDNCQIHETPAMATSLSPPAISQRRSRHDSDSSATRPHVSSYHGPFHDYASSIAQRPSHESHAPLIQHPSEAHPHYYRDRAGSVISDDESSERVSLHAPLMVVTGGELMGLQSRHGYPRANSDPGSPPTEEGLGIKFDQRSGGVERGYGE